MARVGDLSAVVSPRPKPTSPGAMCREHVLVVAREPLATPFGVGARIDPADTDDGVLPVTVTAGESKVVGRVNLRMGVEKCSVLAVAHFAFVEPEWLDD